jgi:predicted nucleic acid-binding protein
MTRVFVDTFYFIALANPRDLAHRKAVQWTAGFQGQMVTTAWVLTEFGNQMCALANRQEFIAMVRDLQASPAAMVLPPDESLFDEGLRLYGNRLDKEWSLTDCTSFVVMTQEGILEALTADHHFEHAGFVALLK